MAFCSAFTLENPKAADAAARPRNFVASAETLVPRQLADPGTPANLGCCCCINTPKAIGTLPTGIVALTVFVAVPITDTVLERVLAT
jgi:hypothetical protein